VLHQLVVCVFSLISLVSFFIQGVAIFGFSRGRRCPRMLVELNLAHEGAVQSNGIQYGRYESEQDAYEGEEGACIETLVKPVSSKVPQYDRQSQCDAELGRNGQRLERRNSRRCAVRHALPRRALPV
jgi:hypothetical protein